jgi:hypothetical protein
MLGCRWRGGLVGSYGGRNTAGNGNIAMRMYTCIGLDDKHLADWSYITGQGNAGEQEIILLVRQLSQRERQGFQLCQERCVEVHQIAAQALHGDESSSSGVL